MSWNWINICRYLTCGLAHSAHLRNSNFLLFFWPSLPLSQFIHLYISKWCSHCDCSHYFLSFFIIFILKFKKKFKVLSNRTMPCIFPRNIKIKLINCLIKHFKLLFQWVTDRSSQLQVKRETWHFPKVVCGAE